MGPVANADPAPSEPIFVHFYYPIETDSKGSTADFSSTSYRQLDGVIRLIRTDQPHRLVLLAPGLYGTPSSMALVARNLASYGYVVAGINDPAQDAPRIGASAADEETRLRPFDFSSAEALEATMRRSSERVKRIASRALTVLDRIDVCVRNSAGLRDRIDLTRVGFVGFSFGGGSAAEFLFHGFTYCRRRQSGRLAIRSRLENSRERSLFDDAQRFLSKDFVQSQFAAAL